VVDELDCRRRRLCGDWLAVPGRWQSQCRSSRLGEALRDKAWMFALPFVVVAGVAAINAWYRRRLLNTQSGFESLRAMSWQDFERLVGEAYRRQGYAVEEVGGSAPDGGFDLVLHRQGGKFVVQCKRWRSAQVDVTLIREFFGVMVAENAARGIFVSTSRFSPDAVEFARGKPLDLVDGARLADLIKGLQRGATSPTEATAPTCPKCGGGMARRVARRGSSVGHEFWGCKRYPQCSGTRDTEMGAS